jgi:uncharacterized damage-inducible protein DinB
MNLPFPIEQAVGKIFLQLGGALADLSDDDYRKPLDVLSGSSIGQHTRHIIEFFKVLTAQYESGSVNYDKRERDQQLESDKNNALNVISMIQSSILLEDREMTLTGVYAGHPDEISVKTTYHRELIYNLEHAIHHMAIIKIGFRYLTDLSLPSEFGVAAATTRHRQSIL